MPRGTIPKPPDQRHPRSSTKGMGVIEGGVTTAPAPPDGFLASTKAAWYEFWASDVAKAVATKSDGMALRRLFGMYDERERMAKAVKNNRLVEGSKNQMVLNPLIREIASMDAEIRQLEDRFGLSPLARFRLGITVNAARQSLADLNAAIDDDEEDEPVVSVVEVTASR